MPSRRNQQRDNTTARGYGWTHQQLRARLLTDLAANPGQPCTRCTQPMYVHQELHLDHNDDRTGYRGLAHKRCNLVAASRKAHTLRRRRNTTFTPTREW